MKIISIQETEVKGAIFFTFCVFLAMVIILLLLFKYHRKKMYPSPIKLKRIVKQTVV